MRVELTSEIQMDVNSQDVTGKMYDILESAPLSWQRSLKSQRTVNSLSSTNVKMM